MSVLQKIQIKLFGKNPAVLGLRGSGKSTLLHYIQTGKIRTIYEPTNSELITRNTFIFNTHSPIKLRKNVKDLGGSKEFHARWKEQINNAQLIIYIIDCEQWLSERQEEIQNEIAIDLETISTALNHKKGIFSTILFINKFDIVKSKYKDLQEHELKSKVSSFTFINGCRLKLNKKTALCNVIIGNLNTSEDALSTLNNLAEVA